MVDIIIAACIGLTQLVLTAIGIYLTLKTSSKAHVPWVLFVFLVGTLGVGRTAIAAWGSAEFQSTASTNILSAQMAAQHADQEMRIARREQHEAELRLRHRLDRVSSDTQSSVIKSQADTQSSVFQMLHPPRALSQAQQNTIIEMLRRSGTHVIAIHSSSGQESEDYSAQIAATLTSAGWTVHQFGNKTQYEPFGLSVCVHDAHKAPPGAAQLLDALHFAGVRVGVGQSAKIREDVIVLIVGLNEPSK
jgi:hypothetical protein